MSAYGPFWQQLTHAFAQRLGAALADRLVETLRSAWQAATGEGHAAPRPVSELALDRYERADGPFSQLGARQVEAWAGARLMAMTPEQREAVIAAAAAAGGGDGPETLRQLVRVLRRRR